MSAEDYLAKINAVIHAYRNALTDKDEAQRAALRADAIAGLKELGVSEGDAQRWLDAKPGRR